MDIKEFAEKFIKAEEEAWQNGNLEPLEQLEAADIVIHKIPPVAGWEAHKQEIEYGRQMFSVMTQKWEYLTGDGNVFALSFDQKYKLKVAVKWPDIGVSIPDGGTISIDSIWVLRVDTGKIVEGWAKGSYEVQ